MPRILPPDGVRSIAIDNVTPSPRGSLRLMLAIMVSLAGLVASAILLNEHLHIAGSRGALFSPACAADGWFDCQTVLTSKWGSFRGVPTAMLGFFYFAATTAWFLVVGRPSGEARGWHLLAVLVTAIGAAACGWLAYVMYATLGVICKFCAATHVFAGLLFLLTLTLWPRRPQTVVTQVSIPEKREPITVLVPVADSPTFRMIVGALLFAAALAGGGYAEYHRRLDAGQSRTALAETDQLKNDLIALGGQLEACRAGSEALTATTREAEEYKSRLEAYDRDFQAVYLSFIAQPQVDIPIAADDHIRGPADAPHTVVVFSDFQCPMCRQLARILDAKHEKYPDQFRLVYKHFPLHKDCNPHAKGTAHAAACPAAQVAEAAVSVGGEEAFWKVHDRMYEDFNLFAKGPPTKFVIDLSRELNVDTAEFWQVVGGDEVRQRIARDTDVAAALGVDATPAVFCDGRRVSGWINEQFWEIVLAPPRGSRPATAPASATAPSDQ